MVTYDFQVQLTKGEAAEKILDTFYRTCGFQVISVSRELESLGIDRIFTTPAGYRYSVEYKTDEIAGKTGNVFMETVSINNQNKAGWVYTSVAQMLFYYLPDLGKVYRVEFTALRKVIPIWQKRFIKKEVSNTSYKGEGILVPLSEFEKICVGVDMV